MRLEWLEDLLAIVDHGGLARAAEARRLTQPAFSRRIRSIEEHVGVDLVDRSSKPVRLTAATLAQEARMRELAAGLRQIGRDLRRQGDQFRNSVVLASQHAITTSLAPRLLRHHLPTAADFRLRSANREECYTLVMTRQADIALAYQTATDPFATDDDFLEGQSLGWDWLVPVFATFAVEAIRDRLVGGDLPAILYPADVFLGRLMEREVMGRLPARAYPGQAGGDGADPGSAATGARGDRRGLDPARARRPRPRPRHSGRSVRPAATRRDRDHGVPAAPTRTRSCDRGSCLGAPCRHR